MQTLFIKYCHSHDQRASLESTLKNENAHDKILNSSVTPKDLTIKYHTEGSACRIENVRLDRLKTGLNMDKIEDDIDHGLDNESKQVSSPTE